MSSSTITSADFIARWKESGGGEMANSHSFLKELCTLLDLPEPEPTVPDEAKNTYVFEKAVLFNNGDGTTSQGRVDLYRQGCFVLESKQGSERRSAEQAQALAETTKTQKRRAGTAPRGTLQWDLAMRRAFKQAKGYAEAIPGEWPPFLIVSDVGHCFDLYADFTQSGKNYIPFPDPKNFRIRLDRLQEGSVRELFRTIWLSPHDLDPAKISARATRSLAAKLAELAKQLEARKDDPGRPMFTPERVANFLMRCLFTMFAEDVELLPKHGFTEAMKKIRSAPVKFAPMTTELWKTMNTGGFSNLLLENLLRFNGGLFEDFEALPLNADQLELLIEAGEANWRDVEPAIFGTLLERALDPVERHKLGAHYTPRAYVERLVMPTLIEPLREQWETAYAAATLHDEAGNKPEAIKTIRQFHEQLCETRVLDPACGSGNFLYVSLELMKRLEGEVLNALREFGDTQIPLLTIDPHQLLGIEVNPRAAAITDLVLWIGYLQWHFRTRGQGQKPQEPVIRNFHNIECRDAVLAWDKVEEVTDENGNPITRWDGRTTKPHSITGEEVPDETARVTELRYINPRKAEWPQADYIVGNPPFVGDKMMKLALGDEYVAALRKIYKELGGSCDYVIYWWDHAANLVRSNVVKRFGFIATNSLRQNFNRRAIQDHLTATNPISILFAIPDHPWVDSADGADVRISMTVGVAGECIGHLQRVTCEPRIGTKNPKVDLCDLHGRIQADLTVGAAVVDAISLKANRGLSCPGVKLFGQGFVIDEPQARKFGYGSEHRLNSIIRPYIIAREITQSPKNRYVIDALGFDSEELQSAYPSVYQWLLNYVKPERDQNRRDSYRRYWWLFGEPRKTFRLALSEIRRQIVTPETSKHRFFQFLPSETIAEGTLVVVALDDGFAFGVLSSRVHSCWALAAGSRLGVGNDPRYNKSRCFDPFPFPEPDESLRQKIRELGEQLDAHRKRQQEQFPELTMTGMYNVLEKLRAGEALSPKEQTIHEQGLVSVLKEIHDRLDEAVLDAYGWPYDLGEEEILEKLVELNAQRAAEEQKGIIRYLRPDFQNPAGAKSKAVQKDLGITPEEEVPAKPAGRKPKKQPWPKSLPERFQAVKSLLEQAGSPLSPGDCSGHFSRAKADTMSELLETLADLGQARQTEDGRFVPL